MKVLAIILALVIIAAVVGYLLSERHPGYDVYYGLAKLTGSRLDIGPVDWATLTRHPTPNDALVCPAARCPNAKPDAEPKSYVSGAAELLARLKTIALAERDTTELSCAPHCDRIARILQHTRIMRYPDTIDIETFSVGENRSTLAIYSRSLIGHGDLGVNRARIKRWLAALDAS
jgi:uncharacterized protein (DUF1499 family)